MAGLLDQTEANELLYPPIAAESGVTVDGIRFIVDALYAAVGFFTDEIAQIDAKQLCHAIVRSAVDYFNDSAEAVELLHEWGIRQSEDVGRAVFALQRQGLLALGDRLTISEFDGLFVTARDLPTKLWDVTVTSEMEVFTTIADVRQFRRRIGKLAFVPTMGALHAGHMSLIAEAKKRAPHVAVSIFVNPTQFGPHEDFTKYPRPIEKDLEMCREAGVDFVFNPSPEAMYRPGLPKITVDLPELTTVLEGAHRPGHFNGVCQVVAKLFNIVQPDVACFGQKDYQQLTILTAMVEALDWPIDMIACPTLREPDGLAMSSRNRYLSAEDRQRALSISRGLFGVRDRVAKGSRDARMLIADVEDELTSHQMKIDYVAAIEPKTLKPVDTVDRPTVFAIAARVGTTRLIDNLLVSP